MNKSVITPTSSQNILNNYYVDFHTHLDWYEDKDQLLNQLKNFNGTIVAASVNKESFVKNCEIKNDAEALGLDVKIIPTLGIHPKDVLSEIAGGNLDDYLPLLEKSPLIGEIGMDFCWYKDASPQQQEKVLRFFLEYCNATNKYCVIHTKDAEQQIADILLDYPDAKPIIHWYDGPESVYDEYINRGYMQTFGCETIRSNHLKNLLLKTPDELILAETDNPTAEPWLGGTDNSVHLIKRIYNELAEIKKCSLEKMAEIINNNSVKILNSV